MFLKKIYHGFKRSASSATAKPVESTGPRTNVFWHSIRAIWDERLKWLRMAWQAVMVLALILLIFVLFAPWRARAESRLVIDGSTTVLPLMQKVLEAFIQEQGDKNLSVSLSGGGTSNGIKALMEGNASVAMASRTITSKEIALARKKNIELMEHVIALDVILPIVHPKNPVQSLTLEQLRDIFAGKIRNWKQVGGDDLSIVVVSRDSSSGTYESWQSIVMGRETKIFPGALMQASSGAVLYTIGNNRRSISYEGVGYLNSKIKPLAVNGVEGNEQTALDKSYPLSRTLQLYTNGQPSGLAKKFIDFTLSERGQALVAQSGLIRVNTQQSAIPLPDVPYGGAPGEGTPALAQPDPTDKGGAK